MKKSLLGLVAVGALIAGPAMAADMPLKAPPAPMAPACIWCGFYIGINIGGAWANNTDNVSISPAVGAAPFATVSGSNQLSGVIGGGQIGYNWQFDRVVLGVEADIDGSSQSGTAAGLIVGPGVVVPGSLTGSSTDKIRDFGTVRARLGLPFGNWMPYVTGGFAWQNVSQAVGYTASAVAPTPGTFALMSNTATLTGWTIGGGVEGQLTGRWTWRAEYLYIDTGRYNTTTGALSAAAAAAVALPAGTVVSESTRFTNNVFRVGVSYYFGGPAAIATRY